MKKYIKRVLRGLLKQNNGSSIVIVIVAIAFVGILGATIMWMSLSNYMMKTTDAKHKESFYSAETVFEQIMAGLQVDASIAVDNAYVYVMQRYSTLNEGERNHEFQVQYLSALQKKLSNGGPLNKFDLDVLIDYVDPKVLDTTGGRIRSLTSTNCNLVMKDTYIILEDLVLEYEDDHDFLTRITTNMIVSVPENDFTQSDSMPELFDYCIIANEKLENPDMTGYMTINGNIYGGQDGMDIYNHMTIQNAEQIVTSGNIILKNTSPQVANHNVSLTVGHADDDDIPSVWAENVLIEGGQVDLYSKTYVADDIKVMGRNCVVNLEQEYYGYGNAVNDEKKSSSIVINNVDSTIDMSNLDKLLIAGHAYIGTAAAKTVDTTPVADATYVPNYDTNTDIMMGESIALKGNQIAYLVPDECIGILDGESVIGKNPMSGTEYTALLKYQAENPATFQEISFDRPLSVMDKSVSLSYYANPGTGYKKIFVPSNGETLVYYYLVMTEAKANEYFKDYYGFHADKLDRYFNLYASGGIKANEFTRVNVQGNYMTSVPGFDVYGANTQIVSVNEARMQDETLLAGECANYTDIFSALKAKLITNYFKVSATERMQTVFENIVKEDALNTFISSVGGSTVTMKLPDGSDVAAIMTKEASYTYGASSPDYTRLLIATGDVIVEKDFTGLIIAKGTVTLKNGATVISSAGNGAFNEKEQLKLILQCKYSESASPLVTTVETKPIELFINGSSYTLDGTVVNPDDDTETMNNIDVTKLVRYDKWIKK